MHAASLIPIVSSLTLTISACSGDSDQLSNELGVAESETSGEENESVFLDPEATESAFGLTQRDSLQTLNLPVDGVQLGGYKLESSYPNLAFFEAALVDDVPSENRMVVVEQKGRIRVFNDDPEVSTMHSILDISDKIATVSGEQGLLGMAFDPEFTQNRYVYIYYTEIETNTSIITRHTWDRETDVLDESQEKVILTVDQPFETHNAGMIVFGPDNYLYIALGDGGDGGDPFNLAQDRSSLLGSVLRIDVNTGSDEIPYLVPDSNPFVGELDVRPEIFAYGFRNPWRMAFDRQTGDLWLGDVGQQSFEEINIVKSGGNYGWRVFEGNRPQESKGNDLPLSAFTPPIYEYDHDTGLAVIGGYVYRGSVSELQGRYIFSDF